MGPVRNPSQFGNHEANAVIRYVEVYEIQADPGEEDDFPAPPQPVQVKALLYTGSVPASTGVITTDNADIVVRTRKSGQKNGATGNGITVAFAIDGGITGPAEAAFNETTDALTIKVKTAATTWAEVAAGVAGLLGGAFTVESDTPTAAVGAGIGSETGTLADGANGEYETYGNPFGIGDRSLTTRYAVGLRLWVIWRPDSQRWEPLDVEKPRALRGTYLSGTTTLLIDNIVVLDSGTDPREDPLDAAETVEVANVPADTYSAGQKVYADWSAVGEQWEARPKAGAGSSDTYRLLRGKVKGAVSADDTQFIIDNIVVLAGGLDPRDTPGDMAEELAVANLARETLGDNVDVVVAYSAAVLTDVDWELLRVERYRALRGTWYSGTTTLSVKNVFPLDSGLDPRTDPADADEIVSVINVPGDTYTTDERVYADYNADAGDGSGRWEARPKPGISTVSPLLTCEISTPISSGTADTPASGTGEVFDVDDTGTATTRGSGKDIYNPFNHSVKGSCTCMEIGTSDTYLLAGFDLLEALYLLTGAAEKTTLALPESESGPTDIQWLGAECEE